MRIHIRICTFRRFYCMYVPVQLLRSYCMYVPALLLYVRSDAVTVCAFRRSYCMCVPAQLLFVRSGAVTVCAFRRSYCMCVPANVLNRKGILTLVNAGVKDSFYLEVYRLRKLLPHVVFGCRPRWTSEEERV
jgi:hypothetical protein